MKRILPLVAVALSVLLASSTASLAKPSTVRSIPPPDPVSSLSADALGVVNYYGGLALHEYLQGIQRADDERVAREAEEARQAALRAAPRASVPAAPVVQTGWPSSLYPCGGDLPPCYVKQRESGGDYNARNPSSSASGAWQFLDSTWAGFGGYSRAYLAPPDVQDARARELWAGGRGCGHWSAC